MAASYSFGSLSYTGSSSYTPAWVGWYSFGSGNITSIASQTLSLTGRYRVKNLTYQGSSVSGAKYLYYCIRITDSSASSPYSYTNSYAYKKVSPSISGNVGTISFNLDVVLPKGNYKVWIYHEFNSTYGNTYAMLGGGSNGLHKTSDTFELAVPSFRAKTVSGVAAENIDKILVKTSASTWSEVDKSVTKTASAVWSEVDG